MRNYLSISFAVFYWLISMGMGLHLHYCGGQIANMALYAQDNKSCCCPSDTSDNSMADCCHNEAVLFQSATETIPKSSKISFASQTVQAVAKPKVRFNLEDLLIGHVEQEKPLEPFPPPKQLSGKSFRIVCQSLVFYA